MLLHNMQVQRVRELFRCLIQSACKFAALVFVFEGKVQCALRPCQQQHTGDIAPGCTCSHHVHPLPVPEVAEPEVRPAGQQQVQREIPDKPGYGRIKVFLCQVPYGARILLLIILLLIIIILIILIFL